MKGLTVFAIVTGIALVFSFLITYSGVSYSAAPTCTPSCTLGTTCFYGTCLFDNCNGLPSDIYADSSCSNACTGGKTCQSSGYNCCLDVDCAAGTFPTYRCVAGGNDVCTPCTPPFCSCGGTCVNRQTDKNNCGACGIACPTGQTCANGACSGNTTGGIPCGSTTCSSNMTCVNGVCLKLYLPSYKQCEDSSDCRSKLSDSWMCVNSTCIQTFSTVSFTWSYRDTVGYSTCRCKTENVTSCNDIDCTNKEYSLPNPAGASSPPQTIKNMPPSGQEKCLYSVEIYGAGTTKNDLCADDKGAICAGPSCSYAAGFLQYPGPSAGCKNQYSSANRFDATKSFIGTNATGLTLQRQYSLYAEDLNAATCGSDQCESRSVSVNMGLTRLVPSKVQKCEYINGSSKPSIVPMCNGTDGECTQFGARPFCIPCKALNNWTVAKSSSSCEGPYRILNYEEAYMEYTCSKEVKDPINGIYKTCAGRATDTRTGTKRSFCKYGCSNGACNSNIKPDLTSVEAEPKNVGMIQSVEVKSIAMDPNLLYTGYDGRQEKIKLECSTGRANASKEFDAVCKGGSVPYVDISWTLTQATLQNVLRKYTDGSKTFERLVSETKPVKSSYRDTDVQFGHSYIYSYIPDQNKVMAIQVNVTPADCGAEIFTGSCDAPNGIPTKYQSAVRDAVNSYLTANPSVASGSASDSAQVAKYLKGVADMLESRGFIAGGSVLNCQNNPTLNSIMVGNTTDQYAEHYTILSGSAGTIGDKKAYSYKEHANWQRCNCGGPQTITGHAVTYPTFPVTGNAAMSPINCLQVKLNQENECNFRSANNSIITSLGCTDIHMSGTVKNNCNGNAMIKFYSLGSTQSGSGIVGPEESDFDTSPAWFRQYPGTMAPGGNYSFEFTYDITKFDCGRLYSSAVFNVEGQDHEQELFTSAFSYGRDCITGSGGQNTSGSANCVETGEYECPPVPYPYTEVVCPGSGGWKYPTCGQQLEGTAAWGLRSGNLDMYIAPNGQRYLFNKPKGGTTDPITWQWFYAPEPTDWDGWCYDAGQDYGTNIELDENGNPILSGGGGWAMYPGTGPTMPFSARCPDGSSGGLDYSNYQYCGAARLGKDCRRNAMSECNTGPIQVDPHKPANWSLYCPNLFTTEKAVCSSVGGTVYDGTDGKWCGVIGSRLYDLMHGYEQMYIDNSGKRYLFFPSGYGVEDVAKWFWTEAPAADDVEAWCNTNPDPLPPVAWPRTVPQIPWTIRCPDGSSGGIDYSKYQQCMYWKVGVASPDQNPAATGGDCLCVGNYSESNPSCTISAFPPEWKRGTQIIYCRARDETGWFSDSRSTQIYIDGTAPTSTITSPDDNSKQTAPFVVRVTDADDLALDKCYFYTDSFTGYLSSFKPKERDCNKAFMLRIGPGGDCPNHGPCTLRIYATDASGNTGIPAEKTFDIKLLYTNITSPADSTYQLKNFSVTAEDRLLFAANTTNLTCTYDVYSISNLPRKTINNSLRPCNGNFTVSIGPGNDCDALGENSCKVVTRVTARMSGKPVEDTDENFYGVDWVTPFSTILAAPTGWVNSDVTILVEDNPQMSVLTDCQYRVTSGGTETVKWTSRPCGTAAEPSEIKITVGQSKQCKHEGGEACRIFVRPLGRNSAPGLGDNATISVMLNGNVTDYDGFSVVGYLATYRGINFTGTTRTELRAATFYVCNADSKLADCLRAQSNGDTGVRSASYCGGFMQGLSGRCELRCNDQDVSFYMVAKGQPLTGAIRTETVVSPVETATCPTFRIDEINRLLNVFYELQATLNIQIMEIDTFIRLNGEDELANSNTLAMMNEALILTDDHINYMETAMQDLNVFVAQEIIERSNDRLDEINALLRQIRQPTLVQMTVGIPQNVRYNTTASAPVSVAKSGPTPAYGKIYCSIIKPGGTVTKYASECLSFSSVYDIEFFANRIGTWSYSCNIGRSVRSDCSFEVNATPVTGTFQVMPGLGSYIEAISAPVNVVKGRQVVVSAAVRNPDEAMKYLNVRCDFTDPQGFMRRNTSACYDIGPGESQTIPVYMLADRLGNWTATRCTVFASGFEGCQNLLTDNVSLAVLNYSAMLPTDVYIEALDIPAGPINNGTMVRINTLVQNPSNVPAFVTFGCDVRTPDNAFTLSGRRQMDMHTETSFMLNMTADVLGDWIVEKCYTMKSTNADYTGSAVTYTLDNLGGFAVIRGTKLYFASYSLPEGAAPGTTASIDFIIRNPSVPRYAQVTCQYRNPLNSPSTASSDCVSLGENEAKPLPVGIMVDSLGTWTIESCSVFGSINPDCSQSSVHDTLAPAGSFDSPGRGGLNGIASYEIFIESISAPARAYNNSRTNAILTVRNTNTNTSVYSTTTCTFTNPLNGIIRQTSSCKYLEASSKAVFALPVQLNLIGTWNIRDCSVNISTYTNCDYSSLYNTSEGTKTMSVMAAPDLYVSLVNAPDNNVVNNSDVSIGVTVENPLNDDRFGVLKCTIADPNGGTQTKTAACTIVTKKSYKPFALSVFANTAGTWIVSNCSVDASTSTACLNSGTTGELINGDTFDVVRGYNLQFSSLAPDNPSYIGAPTNIAYTVNNPSSTDRYGRVKCTATKGSLALSNNSNCFAIGRESFVSSNLMIVANSTGSWSLACSIEKSFDNTCSSPDVDETANRAFDVVTPPDLFIQSVEVPQMAVKNRKIDVIVKVRNLGLQKFYGTVGCTFKNAVNETTTNVTGCMDMTKDTTAAIVSYKPSLKGKLDIYDCYVNGATASDCSGSERHNTSGITKTVTVTSPILTIESISLASTSLQTGELLDIAVSVMNNDEKSHGGFVNCTVADPRGRVYKLTTGRQMFDLGDVKIFHAQRTVDAAGKWVVQSCSIYRQDSPPVLDDMGSINQTIDVSSVAPVESCSESVPCRTGYECVNNVCVQGSGCSLTSCPGVNDACYCSGSSCISCGTGFMCSEGRCVVDENVRTCVEKADCPEGMSCVNGICTEGATDCLSTEDCGNGLECSEGRCIVPSGGLDPKLTGILLVLLSAVSVPIVLFIYIKRVI